MTIFTIMLIVTAIILLALYCVSQSNAADLESARGSAVRQLELERAEHDTTRIKYKRVTEMYATEKREREYAEGDVNNLQRELKELREKVYEQTKLCGIKFTANIPLSGWTKTEFKLGVGPCGKEVTNIQLIEKPDHYIVTQWCTDGERKEFEYKKEDVAGRIERAYRPRQK